MIPSPPQYHTAYPGYLGHTTSNLANSLESNLASDLVSLERTVTNRRDKNESSTGDYTDSVSDPSQNIKNLLQSPNEKAGKADRTSDRHRDSGRRRDRASSIISRSSEDYTTSSSSDSQSRRDDRDHRRIRRLEAANKVAMAKDEQKTRDRKNRSAFAKTWGLVASGSALLEGLDAAF